MKGKRFTPNEVRPPKRYITLTIPLAGILGGRWVAMLIVIIISNYLTHKIWNPELFLTGIRNGNMLTATETTEVVDRLFLLEKAAIHISGIDEFETKVKEISAMMNIPPEWLMAVMYFESRFDPGVLNYKGSGAVGLIQFMPSTAKELQVSVERLKRMEAVQQLEYVYLYLQTQRERYGDFTDLTDLYLSVLYPKARHQDYCYSIFAQPSKAYKQNSGLDLNRDGIITISDIDRKLQQMFPSAFHISGEHQTEN